MKFFSCQPDTHNGFGALNNCTLSYISVDRPKDEDGLGGSRAEERNGTTSSCSPCPLPAGRHPPHRDAERLFSSSSSAVSQGPHHHPHGKSGYQPHGSSSHSTARPHAVPPRRELNAAAGGGSGAYDAVSDATSTTNTATVRVQYMLALPECFHATHSCFSMANYSVFGTDMSFVGTSKGLLALVMMEERKLIYAPLKDPRTVSEEALRYQQMRQEQQQREALFGDRSSAAAGAAAGSHNGNHPNLGSTHLLSSRNNKPPYGGYTHYREGSPQQQQQQQQGRAGPGATIAQEAPSTITWMRDMPLVLVGYSTGKVDWFRVYVSAAKRQQIDQRRKEHLEGIVGGGGGLLRKATTTTTSGNAAPNAGPLFGAATKNTNRSRRQVQFPAEHHHHHHHHAYQEDEAELLTGATAAAMPASQFVHHLAPQPTGAAAPIEEVHVDGEGDGVHIELVASCLLPGAGALLSSDYFPAHGSVAVGGDHGIYLFSTECMERPLCSFTCFGCDYLYCHPLLPVIGTLSNGWRAKEEVSCWHLEERAAAAKATGGSATAMAADDVTEHEKLLLTPVWPSSASLASFSGAVLNLFELAETKGESATKLQTTATTAAGAKGEQLTSGQLPGSGGDDKKDKLMPGGAWLVHVLQHRIPTSSSQRYSTACSFSWKFSLDLELALCNLEEDQLHVVRAVPYLPKASSRPAAAHELHQLRYRVLRENDIHFPLHSSVLNVEYVSAATSVLALPSAAAAIAPENSNPNKGNRGALTASATSQLFAARQLRQWRPAKPVALKEDLLAAEMMDLAVPQPHHHAPSPGQAPPQGHHHQQGHRRRRGSGGGGGGEEVDSHLAVASSGPLQLQQQQQMGATGSPALRAAAWAGAAVAPGQGPYSYVVGMSAMGEVLSVPVETEALAVWGSEQSALCCVGVTLYEATVPDTAEETVGSLMKRRLEAGFALSAAANEEVLRRLSAPRKAGAPPPPPSSSDGGTMEDWRIFFAFVAVLERVQVIGPTDDVPSLLGFVQSTEEHFPLTVEQLVSAGCFSARVAQRSKYHNDPRRLLLLHVLGWLPAEAEEACWAGLPRPDLAAAVERAVVVCVLHDRHMEGAQLLRRYRQLSPAYETLACLLEKDHHTRMAIQSSDTHVREAFLRSLSPWLLTAFLCIRDEAEAGEAAALLQHTPELLSRPQMPLWDRVAMAVLRLPAAPLLGQLLREEVVPYCSAAQALLLVHGVSEGTTAHMQRIVDVTGDCQIAACLYARVAVRCSHVIPDLFQEEAGHDEPLVAEEEPLLTAPARTPDAPPSARVRVAPGQHHGLVASSRLPPPPAQRHTTVAASSAAAAAAAAATAPLTEEGTADCPWLWWAADYRRFMDEEHAFVHRTTFDVACRQLRQGPCPQAKPAPSASPPAQGGEDGGVAAAAAGRSSAPPIAPNSQTFFTLVQGMRGERPVCSVCREAVRAPGATAVTDGFVWCTNCGHGGHMEHLVPWFAQHRRCAEFGCMCHCDGSKFL